MIKRKDVLWVMILFLGLTPRALGQATSQPPLTADISLYSQGGPLISFESTFICGLRTCDFGYVVRAPLDTEPFDFSWKGTGLNVSGTLNPVIVSDRKLWGLKGVARPLSSPKDLSGTVAFTQVNGSPGGGTARYYTPPTTPVPLTSRLDQIGDFLNSSWSVEENPILMQASSQVTWLALDEYEYRYTIDNLTTDPLEFDWADAGLAGTVDPNESLEHSFITDLPPLQISGAANALIRGGFFQGPSVTIVPVPEPSSAVLATIAALALLAGRRRFK